MPQSIHDAARMGDKHSLKKLVKKDGKKNTLDVKVIFVSAAEAFACNNQANDYSTVKRLMLMVKLLYILLAKKDILSLWK